MVLKKTLFDDNQVIDHSTGLRKEVTPLEKLKILEDKIATTIERVKTLKDEKALMEKRIKELEGLLNEKNQEVEQLRAEKGLVKSQIEGLLNELETIEIE
jgi:chromosome segregation ATPase